MAKIIAIGEVMIEFSELSAGLFRQSYAGDSFNSAIYMARLGNAVRYMTAFGYDRFSDAALAVMRAESVDASLIERLTGSLPGVYVIENDAVGERRFHYWRDRAPIRDLTLDRCPDWRYAILEADCIYLTGISLAVIGEAGRRILSSWLAEAKSAGVSVALDLNYRARLWTDSKTARVAVEGLLPSCAYLSCSSDDLAAIYPDDKNIGAQIAASGIEVIERQGSLRAVVHLASGEQIVVVGEQVAVIDATSAGDSFNAAYLSTRLRGQSAFESLCSGHRLAREVVGHRGAIIPSYAMKSTMNNEGMGGARG